METIIHSAQNPRFRHWSRVVAKGRLPDGESVLAVEGPRLLQEALEAGWRPVFVAVTPHGVDDLKSNPNRGRFAAVERLVLAPPLYERLADTATPQDPYVLVAPPRRLGAFPTEQTPGGSGTLSELPPGVTRLVVADVIQDPGNLGTILRSARAFGFDFAVATLGTAGIASPKVLRASAGALFRMTIVSGVSPGEIVEWLARRGFLVVILDPHGPVSLAEVQWREPLAIVIGNEAQGPSDEWEKGSGNAGGGPESSRSTASGRPKTRSEFMRVCIPMSPGSESLNTAAAAAIAFHSVSRALFPFH